MDDLGLFVERHAAIHRRFVGDLFAGLSDAQARALRSGTVPVGGAGDLVRCQRGDP